MADQARTRYLAALLGDWQGLTRLYAGHVEVPERTSSAWLRCVQAGSPERFRLRYVWAFEQRVREGHLMFALDSGNGQINAAWMDSGLVGADVLGLRGWLDDSGLLRLSGHASDQGGTDWVWRLELDTPEPARLELRLYTVSPQGGEELAASAEYRR